MVFALNFPNAGMILWSDFQSVKGEGPQGFGSLCQPPVPPPRTSDPDAYKSPPVELVWPHGRKYHLERSANWRAPRHPTSANEQAKWPRRRGREKSRSRLVERGSLWALTLCPGLRATSSSIIKGLSRSTMEKLNCKTLQGKLLLFLGVRGSVLICKQYPLFSWAPSLSSPSPSTLPPPRSPSLFRGNFRQARFSLKTTTPLNKEDLQYLYCLSISNLFCQGEHSENVLCTHAKSKRRSARRVLPVHMFRICVFSSWAAHGTAKCTNRNKAMCGLCALAATMCIY